MMMSAMEAVVSGVAPVICLMSMFYVGSKLGALRERGRLEKESEISDLRLQIPRAEALREQELAGLLNVPDDHPVLRGVLEVMARAEDMTVEDYCKPGASAEYRAEGGVAVRAIRSLRADLLSAVEMARGPKKTKS